MAKDNEKAARDTTLAAQSMGARDAFLQEATEGLYTAHRANGKADSAAYASLAFLTLMSVESIGRLQASGRWEGDTNEKAADSAFSRTLSGFLMHLAYKGFPVFQGADMSVITRIKDRDSRIKAVREHFKVMKEGKARKAKAIRNVQTLARKIVRHVIDNAGELPRDFAGRNDSAGAIVDWRVWLADNIGADMEAVTAFFAGQTQRESDWFVTASKKVGATTFAQLDKLNGLAAAVRDKIAELEAAHARLEEGDDESLVDDSDAYTEEAAAA